MFLKQGDQFVKALNSTTRVNVTVNDAFNNPLVFGQPMYSILVGPEVISPPQSDMKIL